MAILSSGQISIIDYNDAVTLTGIINTNLAKTQMYNPDNNTYTPNWASQNMVLTPSLFKAGSAGDIIASNEVQSVKWYIGNSTTPITANSQYALSGTKSHVLTIKANVLAGLAGQDYRCDVVYLDPTTNLSLTHKMSVTFSRVINGSGITDAIATTPNGYVFKNSSVSSLTAKIELWRGSVIDTTNVSYQWYMMDASVSTDQGGGVGWKKLTDTSGLYTGCTTNTITIYPNAVASYGVFKASIKDTDSASATYNQYFWDVVTIIDNSDPIQVIVESSGGDVFKNGVGSSTLTARLFQAGVEIDTAGTAYNYRWYKYNSNGVLESSWSKTTKSFSITGDDVNVKATFRVDVSTK